MARYIGKISDTKRNYGWIAIATVTKEEDGTPHDLATEKDIYLHRDNYSGPLVEGTEVNFVVGLDEKRGEGTFRAFNARETERYRLERITKGGIELAVQGLGNSRIIDQSSVFASWCFTAELAAKVKERRSKGKTVKLLFVHWPVHKLDDQTEQRQLVDLSDPMTAIGFNTAGTNRVFALVVSGDSDGDLWNTYLSRRDDYYRSNVISHDECGTVLEDKSEYLGSGCIEAEIPENLFAGKPLDWWWVNWCFKTKPRDQCAFRRRRMFAYTLQPFVALVLGFLFGLMGTLRWIGSFACVVGMLSVGTKRINFEPLRHPLRDSPDMTWWRAGGSVFIPVINGNHVPLPLAFSPPVLVAAALVTMLFVGVHLETLEWWITFGKVMLIPIAVFCIITWFVVSVERVDWEQVMQRRIEEERRKFAAEIDDLICTTTGPRKPDVWQLHFGPKTVRFYALALKQKLCKRFAAA